MATPLVADGPLTIRRRDTQDGIEEIEMDPLLKLVLTGAELVAEEEEVTMADGTVKVKKSGPTPEQTLRTALDDEAYDVVRMKLSALTSGPLAAYSFEREEAGFELVDLE